MAITVKTQQELRLMRQAGRIVAVTLALVAEKIRPGITTGELDALAHKHIVKQKAIPAFKGYRGFPASLCVSVNEQVVHGIPGKKRVLQEGDIVSLDLGAIYKGWYGDAAITVGVGEISQEAAALIETTRGALYAGIGAARVGNRLGDISWAIQSYAESRGYSVVREFVGHGIGRQMHEEPQIPNFGPPHRGPVLAAGMTLALEPMVNAGSWEVRIEPDMWTVVTRDGRLSAHFEHTIAVAEGGAEILTKA